MELSEACSIAHLILAFLSNGNRSDYAGSWPSVAFEFVLKQEKMKQSILSVVFTFLDGHFA